MHDNTGVDESIDKAKEQKTSYEGMVNLVSKMDFQDLNDMELLNGVKGYESQNKNAINKTNIIKTELEQIQTVLSGSLNKINDVSEDSTTNPNPTNSMA